MGKTLRFRTRNYKHEIRLSPGAPRSILGYSEELWERLCREIARRDFTGLVLYAGQHPFEFILDYAGFPHAASRPRRECAAVRAALNRGLAVAHRHGLKTFMQHYVTHFTVPLAKHVGVRTPGRLANIDHPEMTRYQRWCYREIFRQCPDLDGLYFNFESAQNATAQILKTAILEFNRMKRKPIAVFRLWGANDPKGVGTLVKAYRGRSILAHKISDSNDTSYLPVADSRASEWKRLLPDVEFMFIVGPCHNCGTNLCNALWADYDFVQEILRDAERKGADSISFHCVNEFFSPDVRAKGLFSAHELAMARHNVLHLDAVVDYVHGRRKSRRERAMRLSERAGVSVRAGRHLLDAVERSSQIILLAYQQFCYGSAREGYLDPGRHSHVQEPFFFYPATELNDQASRLMWQPVRTGSAWLKKRVDTRVTPAGMLQYVIDAVDPSKPNATRSPRKLAALLERSVRGSLTALARCRKAAGKRPADALAPTIKRNAALGEFVRREILAAAHLYGVYFAGTRPAVLSRLRRGLNELEAQRPVLRLARAELAAMKRALLFDRFDVKWDIALVKRVLRAVERTDFPMSAYRDYLASRREYNEIRRVVRAGRRHGPKTVAYAARHLKAALSKAADSLSALEAPRHVKLAAHVERWVEFLESELARTRPPKAVCRATPSERLGLLWDHCFRRGEHFAEDFLGFFEDLPLAPTLNLSFRTWRTAKHLVVALREEDIDVKERRRLWRKLGDTSSASFLMRVHVDVEGKGRNHRTFIVWPMGESVSAGKRPHVSARTSFASHGRSWEMTVRLPWSLLGRRPRKGETWRLNVTSNPSFERNRQFTWAPQYDASSGNPLLFGRLRFE